jgi:cysteine protease ATG4
MTELEELRNDIKSRIWITYRRNFVPIGGPSGAQSDTGWGCMLRCGQMALAQAFINKHLTRDWRWTQNDTIQSNLQYREVLKLFQEKKNCIYSIHQIAQMGVSEGKTVGQWFGPNTIAQVLK